MRASDHQSLEPKKGLTRSTIGGTRTLLARASCLAIGVALLGLGAAPALAANGDLTQKPDPAGCISNDGSGGVCLQGDGVASATSVAFSPDGKNAYVVARGNGENNLTIFDRDSASGALTQKPGPLGCITDNANSPRAGCALGRALGGPNSVAVSADGRNVYVAADGGLSIFDRDTGTGELTQKSGSAGCIASNIPSCAFGNAGGGTSVAVSPDGISVYEAAFDYVAGGRLSIFDRDPATGALTQKPDTQGCISETGSGGICSASTGRSLAYASGVTVSPDGKNVYVAAIGGLSVFDRDSTGALTQKAGTAGCFSESGSSGSCTVAPGVGGPIGVTVSPDGTSVYAAGYGGLSVFDRDSTGALTQKAGTAGCFFTPGSNAACTDARGISLPTSVTVAPDGTSVYVTDIYLPGIVIFDRDPATGALTQKPGSKGCISDGGDDGVGGTCVKGTALTSSLFAAVSPDGKNAYVTTDPGLAIFDREDTSAPQTTITAGPADGSSTADSTANFGFSSNEPLSRFECRVDGGAFGSCSSPFTAGSLGAGQHTFSVRATDPSGNVDPTPATRTFTVTGSPAPPADGTPAPAGGTPPPPSSGPSPVGTSDTTRPVINGLGVFPARFSIGSLLPRLAHAARVGTTIRFSLSERAAVKLSFARRHSGRLVGHTCRPATAALRSRPACRRYVTVTPSVRFARARAGANRVRFQGRLSRTRTLRPGHYRLTLTATDPAGNRSQPKRALLTVMRRVRTP